ncbi:hypothetical protein [Sinisalibacter aestuarii]|uniref:Uncharacterized protein n=1 Tax=Sinisalibacter aestuarii TaxID=2949426 RepID=A0ABQ5LT30_9RHOB|nr:hypothetical protein [Sinisalibacter aestuarii]GKY87416.1 hypothetical protein STA1M1_12850 [Sinisalibacter aestuarii]
MKRRIAFPFLTLPDEVVGFCGWMIGDPGQPLLKAEDCLEGWDYERDIEVNARLKPDFEAIAEALDLNKEDVALTVVLKGGTGAGTMPRRVERLAGASLTEEQPEVDLGAVIGSERLSGRLRLEVSILLEKAPVAPGPLSPMLVGARLWTDRKDILLEDGGDARFPIEVISFAEAFRDPGISFAPWFIHWRVGALDGDFGGSVRVYVNSDDLVTSERFVNGDPATLQAILGDVMSQLISAVVRMDDADDHLAECSEGSVGEQVRRWMDMAFPGRSARSILSVLEATPGRFHSAILAAARVGGEE